MAVLLASTIALAALLFASPILGLALGAFAGWVAGLVFDDSMRLLAQTLGIDAAPYQLGAIFGFVGGFFRSTPTIK